MPQQKLTKPAISAARLKEERLGFASETDYAWASSPVPTTLALPLRRNVKNPMTRGPRLNNRVADGY
jgi:hypothetical protein